ncbi:hypothetical protein KM043_010802 [Ampulex compressa]|nr:hypothetical protein KM043_010802 [Ampulex compressa]
MRHTAAEQGAVPQTGEGETFCYVPRRPIACRRESQSYRRRATIRVSHCPSPRSRADSLDRHLDSSALTYPSTEAAPEYLPRSLIVLESRSSSSRIFLDPSGPRRASEAVPAYRGSSLFAGTSRPDLDATSASRFGERISSSRDDGWVDEDLAPA